MAGPFVPVPREQGVLDKFGSTNASREAMLCRVPYTHRPPGPSALTSGLDGPVLLF